jgi:predicted DNA-binding transcriptional regulator AlpA
MATQHTPARPFLFSSGVRAEFGGIGATTLWRWVKRGLIPEPHHLGTRAVWFADEIAAAKQRLLQPPAGRS